MSQIKDIIEFLKTQPDDSVHVAACWAYVNGMKLPYIDGAPPPQMRQASVPQMVGGRVNPDWIVERRDILLDYNTAWFNYYGAEWSNFRSHMDAVDEFAAQVGVDLSRYSPETFSLADIQSVDSVLEATGKQLTRLADRIEYSHEVGMVMLDAAKKKSWAATLRRAAEIQEWCREEVPAHVESKGDWREIECWKYLHALRYMIYTVRSVLMGGDEAQIVETPEHVVMACLIIAIARAHCESHGIQGVMVQIAPRHGKTNLAVADKALDLRKRPHLSTSIVHNNFERSQERFEAIRDHFDRDLPVGRRGTALFPDVRMEIGQRGTKGTKKLTLLVDGKRPCQEKEGNLAPRGVHGRVTGITCHEILFDDPVDEKEQAEDGTRERTNSAMNKTWMTRRTGKSSFFVYICTAWHREDFSSQLLKLARQGAFRMAYYAKPCGGPENDFKPIWPEAGYDDKFLRSQFARLGPIQYACIYQNNPDSDATRKIAAIHHFPAKQWTHPHLRTDAWKRFFADPETEHILSVDPSGSENKRSNKAGIIYGACGMLRESLLDRAYLDQAKLAILEYWSLRASQRTLVEKIIEVCGMHRVDKIVVETTGGYHATADTLVEHEAIKSAEIEVIKRQPGTGTKVARFQKYAIHIENGSVLFPGVDGIDERGEPVLAFDPSLWSELSEQLVNAGNTSEDNLLDCMRQLLAEVAYKLFGSAAGNGDASRFGETEEMKRRRQFWESKLRLQKPKTHLPKNALLLTRRTMSCLN